MDSTLTLIGSIVIGGVFLLGVMTFYGDVTEHSHEKMFELLTQETTAGFIEIIDHDFQRIGAGLTGPVPPIFGANVISFRGDVDRDGVVDEVTYTLSSTAAASATENPRDRILYRIVNTDTTINTAAGVDTMIVRFLDAAGSGTTDPFAVRMLDMTLIVESPVPYDTTYARAIWRKRYTPNNLIRRPYTN